MSKSRLAFYGGKWQPIDPMHDYTPAMRNALEAAEAGLRLISGRWRKTGADSAIDPGHAPAVIAALVTRRVVYAHAGGEIRLTGHGVQRLGLLRACRAAARKALS